MTAPPYVLTAAVVHKILHPGARVILWSQDVYPDAAEEYGTVRRGGLASRILRAVQRWLLRRTDHVVALDEAMLARTLAHVEPEGRPAGSVIPNSEPVALFPSDASPPRWEGYEGLDGFVALYLGNLGFGHPTGTIAEAATRLDTEDVTFLFVGGGVRYPEMAAAARRRGLSDVVLHDYVPKERTPNVLAGADCALISLGDGSLGIMSPCKLHGGLALGTPSRTWDPRATWIGRSRSTRAGSRSDRGTSTGWSKRSAGCATIPRSPRRCRATRKAFEEAYSDEQTLPQFDRLLTEVVLPSPDPGE